MIVVLIGVSLMLSDVEHVDSSETLDPSIAVECRRR